MTDRIITALNGIGASAWIINAVETESFELFTIRHSEDMRRSKKISDCAVTVFNDFESYRGSSTVMIFPSMTDEELISKLRTAYESAGYVKNPYYELPEKYTGTFESIEVDLSCAALQMKQALYAKDTDDTAFINSSEIFAVKTRERVLTSAGTDTAFETLSVKGEFVAQCTQPADVELYFSFDYKNADTQALAALASEALETVRDRARAVNPPKAGKYDVLLTRDALSEIAGTYAEKADAGMVFAHYSNYEVGAEVTGKGLNITLFSNRPVSEDGIYMPERPLIKEGRLLALHGSTRFCRYLGIEPTGSYGCVRLESGTVPLNEMQYDGVLMPVAFSDFQADALRGTFAGEIRLAYLFRDGQKQLVTGGSISGSLTEKQADMVFSRERRRTADYDGPYAVLLRGVSVAGE